MAIHELRSNFIESSVGYCSYSEMMPRAIKRFHAYILRSLTRVQHNLCDMFIEEESLCDKKYPDITDSWLFQLKIRISVYCSIHYLFGNMKVLEMYFVKSLFQIKSNQIKFYLKSAMYIWKKRKNSKKLFTGLYSITNNNKLYIWFKYFGTSLWNRTWPQMKIYFSEF